MSYGNEDRLSNQLPVVKSNPLVEARFRTTALEYKILMVAASKISSKDTVLKDIKFSVQEFCGLLNIEVKGGGMYEYMKRACERLVGKPVSVKNRRFKEYLPDFPEEQIDDCGYMIFPWLHHIRYNKATVYIRFHEFMKPLLLYVLDNVEYTKYLLENITKCESIYSMRIYELLKQYQKIGERTVSVSDLREMLGIEQKEYSKYNDFKRKVLEQSHKEINEKTDILMEYTEKKQGRKVVAIMFYIQAKKEASSSKYNALSVLPKEQLSTLLQREIQNRYVVVLDVAMINAYSERVIKELLTALKDGSFDKTTIHSPVGFFRWQLDEIASKYAE